MQRKTISERMSDVGRRAAPIDPRNLSRSEQIRQGVEKTALNPPAKS
jgi:hypothetical protein